MTTEELKSQGFIFKETHIEKLIINPSLNENNFEVQTFEKNGEIRQIVLDENQRIIEHDISKMRFFDKRFRNLLEILQKEDLLQTYENLKNNSGDHILDFKTVFNFEKEGLVNFLKEVKELGTEDLGYTLSFAKPDIPISNKFKSIFDTFLEADTINEYTTYEDYSNSCHELFVCGKDREWAELSRLFGYDWNYYIYATPMANTVDSMCKIITNYVNKEYKNNDKIDIFKVLNNPLIDEEILDSQVVDYLKEKYIDGHGPDFVKFLKSKNITNVYTIKNFKNNFMDFKNLCESYNIDIKTFSLDEKKKILENILFDSLTNGSHLDIFMGLLRKGYNKEAIYFLLDSTNEERVYFKENIAPLLKREYFEPELFEMKKASTQIDSKICKTIFNREYSKFLDYIADIKSVFKQSNSITECAHKLANVKNNTYSENYIPQYFYYFFPDEFKEFASRVSLDIRNHDLFIKNNYLRRFEKDDIENYSRTLRHFDYLQGVNSIKRISINSDDVEAVHEFLSNLFSYERLNKLCGDIIVNGKVFNYRKLREEYRDEDDVSLANYILINTFFKEDKDLLWQLQKVNIHFLEIYNSIKENKFFVKDDDVTYKNDETKLEKFNILPEFKEIFCKYLDKDSFDKLVSLNNEQFYKLILFSLKNLAVRDDNIPFMEGSNLDYPYIEKETKLFNEFFLNYIKFGIDYEVYNISNPHFIQTSYLYPKDNFGQIEYKINGSNEVVFKSIAFDTSSMEELFNKIKKMENYRHAIYNLEKISFVDGDKPITIEFLRNDTPGYIINGEFYKEIDDNLSSPQKAFCYYYLKTYFPEIKLSEYNLKSLVSMMHDNSLEFEDIGKIFKNFFITNNYFDRSEIQNYNNYLEKCKNAFTEKYITKKGRRMYPKIIESYAALGTYLGIEPTRFTDNFDYKKVRSLLENGMPWIDTVIVTTFLDISYQQKAQNCQNLQNHLKRILEKWKTNGINEEELKWAINHPDTNEKNLLIVLENFDTFSLNANSKLSYVLKKVLESEARLEIKRIEAKYKNFTFDECKFNIKKSEIEINDRKAFIMDKNDERMVMLGEYTNCCQHLGSAGETAMMHGLINASAGFWAIEDKDGKIIAQAEIWETDEKTLVFDNIEFADNRDIDDLRDNIYAWLKTTKYENIIMGLGYNEMNTNNLPTAPAQHPPITPEEVFILDNNRHFKTLEETKEYMKTHSLNYEDCGIYTDADRRCVYLKKNDEIFLKPKNSNLDSIIEKAIKENKKDIYVHKDGKASKEEKYFKRIDKNILEKIKEIEKEAYNKKSYIQMQNCEDVKDLADYMECNVSDIKVIFEDKYYMLLAEHNDYVEIVDFASTKKFMNFKKILSALESLDKPFYCDARKSTSYPIIKYLEKMGKCKITKDEPYDWDGETFHKISFVLETSLEKYFEHLNHNDDDIIF